MKYLKIYENYLNSNGELIDNDKELKKLLSHLISIITNNKNYNFTEENYYESGKWESNFYISDDYSGNNKFSFCIVLKNSYSSFIDLTVTGNNNEFAKFFKDYLKTINGIKIIKEEILFKGIWKSEYKINNKDVDNIIKQITNDDIEFKLTVNKYNIL